MVQPVLITSILQPAKASAMCTTLHVETLPPTSRIIVKLDFGLQSELVVWVMDQDLETFLH